ECQSTAMLTCRSKKLGVTSPTGQGRMGAEIRSARLHHANRSQFMSSDHKTTLLRQSAEQKRQESEEQLSLLQTITSELAAAGDLSAALEVVPRDGCEKTGWVVGHAWVPNQDETLLEFRSAWYRGDGELKPFRTVSEASQFKLGIGLPGRVWKSQQPAWVEDVTNDPNFPRSAAARTAGLKTGVGIPIVSADKVIAVLEFFMRESRDQNERLVNVIAAVAAQLNLVMEQKRAVEELSRINEILQSILANMGDGVIVADKFGNFLVFNPAAERMFGRGAIHVPPAEWSHNYGLYLPDKVTPFPHDQLPMVRSSRG